MLVQGKNEMELRDLGKSPLGRVEGDCVCGTECHSVLR